MIASLALAASLTVTDGDTFKLPTGERIRLENIDTPESGARAKCDAELFLAVHARAELTRLLGQGEPVITRARRPNGQVKLDKYGRTLARVSVGGIDVGRVMIDRLFAWEWEGRRHDWCAIRAPKGQ